MAKSLPVILLKNFTIFPSQQLKIELGSSLLSTVLMSEDDYQKEIVIVSPKDLLEESLDVQDLPLVAVVSKILKKLSLPDGKIRLIVEGERRIKIHDYFNEEMNSDIFMCHYYSFQEPVIDIKEENSYHKELLKLFQTFLSKSSKQIEITIDYKTLSLSLLTDFIASVLVHDFEKGIFYVETIHPIERAQKLMDDLVQEIKILKLDHQICLALEKDLDEEQKRYILKSKMQEIQKELGEESKKQSEIDHYLHQLEQLDLSQRTKRKIQNEIEKYEFMNESSPDISFVRNYLELFFSLPWNEETIECEDLKSIEKVLNKTHYGLEQVKTRVLEYASMKKRNPFLQAPIICLVGPPGVGKSTIASSIATALHREFYKISVGGLNDSAELTGHRRTYLGSAPGRIVSALQKCGSKNPLILIDEVDKMLKDYKGDPASVLLDILDPNLNQNFVDAYLEEPFDLSHVLFLLTANRVDDIPIELKDRLEIIELSSYSTFEKIHLANDYILPLLRLDYHVSDYELVLSNEALKYLILNYTNEAGVRDLRRKLEELYRKVILNSEKKAQPLENVLEIKDIKKVLEERITIADLEPKLHSYGLVKGLAVTDLGGVTLPIEAVMYEGKGKCFMTGSLGEVMKESIDVVFSFLKNNQVLFGLEKDFFVNKDFHIHALDGSTLKDGSSAGVTITTCLISLMTQKKVPLHIAMTGEMSLRGEVLPVGGIKEKIIGAYNRGITKIFLPEANKVDVKQISKEIKKDLEIVYVTEYKEIYEELFCKS